MFVRGCPWLCGWLPPVVAGYRWSGFASVGSVLLDVQLLVNKKRQDLGSRCICSKNR